MPGRGCAANRHGRVGVELVDTQTFSRSRHFCPATVASGLHVRQVLSQELGPSARELACVCVGFAQAQAGLCGQRRAMRTALHGLSHLRSAHAPSMHTVMPPLVHSATARWHGPGLRAGVARPTAQLLPPRAQAPAVVLNPSKPPEEVDTASLKRYKRAVAAQNVSATDIGLEPGASVC